MVGRRSGFRTRLAAVAAAVGVVAGTAWAGVVSVGAAAAVVIDVPCAGPGGGTPGLIAAIHAANSGGGTITLAPGCTYPLTSADNNNNGLPFIDDAVTINGRGATIAANNTTFRVFAVVFSGNLTLNGTRITGGHVVEDSGGGIFVDRFATLTLNGSRVDHNTASTSPGDTVNGGGIFNVGHLTIGSSSVDHNQIINPSGDAQGGGIFSIGPLSISASHVGDNAASGGADAVGGGIAAFDVTLNAVDVSNNTASATDTGGIARGGGIISAPSLFTAVTLIDNTASAPSGTAQGGGLFVSAPATLTVSVVSTNTATGSSADGGGIYNLDGTITLTLTPVVANVPNNCRPLGTVPGCIN